MRNSLGALFQKMTKKTKTLEQRAADAVLREAKTVVVGGKTYTLKPITVRTLIRLSAQVSELPTFDEIIKEEDRANSTIDRARECGALGDIMALLLLQRGKNDGTLWQKHQFRRLADAALDLYPSQLHVIIDTALAPEEVGYFFGITTFLSASNILRATREVEIKTDPTASGL